MKQQGQILIADFEILVTPRRDEIFLTADFLINPNITKS